MVRIDDVISRCWCLSGASQGVRFHLSFGSIAFEFPYGNVVELGTNTFKVCPCEVTVATELKRLAARERLTTSDGWFVRALSTLYALFPLLSCKSFGTAHLALSIALGIMLLSFISCVKFF